SLFEAEPEGKLSTADSRFSSVESAAVEESVFSPLENHAVEPVYSRDALATTSEVPTPLGEVGESLKKTFGCGSSGGREVEGEGDASLEPKVKRDWSKRGRFAVSMDYAAAWAKGKATAHLAARAVGDLRCEPDPVVLVEPRWRTVVVVGQVPVPITVGLPVELSASANGHTKVFVTAKVKSDATLGVSRSKGDRAKLMKGFSPPKLISGSSPELEATGSAEASVLPAVSVEAGWRVRGLGRLAAVAKLGVRGGIHVGFAAGEQPPVRACVPVKAEASLAVHLVRTSLGPWTFTPYETNLSCRPPDPESEGK